MGQDTNDRDGRSELSGVLIDCGVCPYLADRSFHAFHLLEVGASGFLTRDSRVGPQESSTSLSISDSDSSSPNVSGGLWLATAAGSTASSAKC